jgi:hypothetical protein
VSGNQPEECFRNFMRTFLRRVSVTADHINIEKTRNTHTTSHRHTSTMTRACLLLAACLLLGSTASALEGVEAQLAERAAAATPIIITGGLEAASASLTFAILTELL